MTNFEPADLDLDLPGFLESNDVDARLHAIVALVESMDAGGTEIAVPCQLVVAGAIIKGNLSSRRQWAKANTERAIGAPAQALMRVVEADEPIWRDDEVAEVDGGHLEHFRVHLVNDAPEPNWRIRIKDVNAWSLGGV